MNDGSLLVAEAGTGDMSKPDSGRVVKLMPSLEEQNDLYEIQSVIIDQQPSMNMVSMMKRDEIMGLSEIAEGNGRILVGLTDYVSGSKVIEIFPDVNAPAFSLSGNINSIAYHPELDAWFAIKPDANVVIRLSSEKEESVVTPIADMSDGQDAVPVCIVYEPNTGMLLVTLFSGEIGGETSKLGIDFDKTAGKVIRVDPATGQISDVVCGLTAPTGIALDTDGNLFVLELCDEFLQALIGENATRQCLHGGFKRFSGRLLQIDLRREKVVVIANQLDTPSNLEIVNGRLLISEGMGMPGRPIPNTMGDSQPLTGYIRQLKMNL